MEVVHGSGRRVLLVKVVFRDTHKLKLRNMLFVTVGGTKTARANSCGAEAEWTIGSCKPTSRMPEGAVFSSEEKDRGHLTRTSDTSCMIAGDSDDKRRDALT